MYTYTGDTRDTGGTGNQVRLYDKHFYVRHGRSDEFVRELGDAVERRSRASINSSSSSSSSPRDYQRGRRTRQLAQRGFDAPSTTFTPSTARQVSLSIVK